MPEDQAKKVDTEKELDKETAIKLADHAQRTAIHYSTVRISFVISNITVATLLVGLFFRFSDTLNPWIVSGAILALGAAFTLINQKIGTSHMHYNNVAAMFYKKAIDDVGLGAEFTEVFQKVTSKADRFGFINRWSSQIDFYILWPALNLIVALVAALLVMTH